MRSTTTPDPNSLPEPTETIDWLDGIQDRLKFGLQLSKAEHQVLLEIGLIASHEGQVGIDLTNLAARLRTPLWQVEAAASSLVTRGWLKPAGMTIVSRYVLAVPPTPAKPEPQLDGHSGKKGRTALYRWFDEDGALIYVGISSNVYARSVAHAKASAWSEFASHCTVDWFSTRAAALAAEVTTIHAELPVFNVVHNNTPDAARRLHAYLEGKGRLDLLLQAADTTPTEVDAATGVPTDPDGLFDLQ